MTSLANRVNEQLPHGKLAALGLQHVLVMYAGAVAVPLIVGRALKLSPDQVAMLISADLFCWGLVTLIQSLGATQWSGIKLPVMMGVTFASVAPMVAMANAVPGAAGAQLIFGSIIGAGVVSIVIAPLVSRMLRFFPPVVTGTIIAVIGISLMRIGINWIFGNPFGPTAPNIVNPEHTQWLAEAAAAAGAAVPGLPTMPKGLALVATVSNPKYADPGGVGIAALVLTSILLISRFAKGFLANISVLLGIVIGGIAATSMGLMGFDKVAKAAWFDVVLPLQFGMPVFDPVLILTMSLIMVVVMIESTGMFLALGEMTCKTISQQDLARGMRTDGLGTLIGGLFNTFPYTSFSQNVGRVAATGIRILGTVDFKTWRFNSLIVAISLGIGMIPLIAPNFKQWMPHGIHPLIESGILLSSLSAVLLNLFFNGGQADTGAAVAAARQADAH